ncbi:unnamed protein product [Penicillium salamii]|uniref:Uncharacterized protein n=1 Tax=Penicillium salamii TaxID=1612424 RepID=A0A9W4JJS5_9EURO|nr:unnamed protein product [Penicillium salamii]CAG8189674.1 unnamed protein product [Penicillium salamii]CAG8201773.1 unnamed protein product [Penicillium salamii]CAG8207688.1 unnamed protein product [Penicillium salamii]CAG8236695.1 unnamed protein product [Penicillium salamii]
MGAEKLDSIPLPPRASQCSMPLHLQSDASDDTSYVQRALWATPLLGCYVAANITMGSVIEKTIPLLGPIFRQGTWTASNGETVSLSLYTTSLFSTRSLVVPLPASCLLSVDPTHDLMRKCFPSWLILGLSTGSGYWKAIARALLDLRSCCK